MGEKGEGISEKEVMDDGKMVNDFMLKEKERMMNVWNEK